MANRKTWKAWTDTDEAVVLLFPPKEAAAILGRTLQAVWRHRSLKGMGNTHRDSKPRRRLRRQYFATGQGERDEIVPRPRKRWRRCRQCRRRKVHAHGLCKSCYCRVRYRERVRGD